MGLDTTHDAFHGSYSAFDRFRSVVADATGGSWPPHATEFGPAGESLDPDMWYWGAGYNRHSHPGLAVFFNHPDDEGEISPDDCVKVANDLEALLPTIDAFGMGGGHIERDGGYGAIARKFIAGCRKAAAANESLVFM